MKLRDNKFKTVYNTTRGDDVITEFYIPALSSSKEYLRMSGFFSSSSLAVAAEGISELIKNNGTMKLLTSPYLDSRDLKVLENLDNDDAVQEFLSNKMIQTLEHEKIVENHVEALGWMLANKKLEIRVVLVKKIDGTIPSSDDIDSSGMFHNKVGIFLDEENTVAFSGSINETYAGWRRNIENFSVFCDWEGDSKHIEPHRESFEHYWKLGTTKDSQTIELPVAVKSELIRSVPSDKFDLKIFKETKGTKIRKYQSDAIENWMRNEYIGIFNMATGTGKTITAIHGLRRLLEAEKIAVIVSVPFQHLIDQWVKSIEKELATESFKPNFVLAFDSSKKWISDAKCSVESLNFDVIDNLFIITTYDTLSSEKFINLTRSIRCSKLLIADEVHNAGAPTYATGLLEDYKYRLGLSATPARYMDDEGTTTILDYFIREVYTFDLKRAINEINPDTGKSFLTPYYYHPIFTSLNNNELSRYKELSSKIAKFTTTEDLTEQQKAHKNMLLVKRSRIIKNAANKLTKLEEEIPKLKKEGFMEYSLIYCSDGKDEETEEKTLQKVIECLNYNEIPNQRFIASENAIDRKKILENFNIGNTKALVAIKCLDEGVDVPATRNAIIMASTGNPKEYIQRRGRVLRRVPDKEYAVIFDFIIIPNKIPKDLDTELQILGKEYDRFAEFSKYSINMDENTTVFEEAIGKYKNLVGERE